MKARHEKNWTYLAWVGLVGKEASSGHLARKYALPTYHSTDVREWSRYHEESEWSLMISLMHLFCCGTAQDVLSREFVDPVFHDVIVRCASRRSRGEPMSRGGSFDRLDAGLELYAGWRKRREVGLSNTV